MKTLIAAAAALALVGSAAASDGKGHYSVLGSGAFTCGDFLSGGTEATQIMSIWVHGYATALNQALGGISDVTGGRTDEQITDALFNECNGHNDMVMAEAVRNMVTKMAGLTGPKKAKKGKKSEEPAAPAEEAMPELRR